MNIIESISHIIKEFIILILEYYIFCKFVKDNKNKIFKNIINIIMIIGIGCLSVIFKERYDTFCCIILQIVCMFVLNMINFRRDVGYIFINTIICLGLSYLMLFISVLVSALPHIFFRIENNYVNLMIILSIDIILTWKLLNIKKIKNGLIFLKIKLKNENLDLLLLNVSMIIIFTAMILSSINEIDIKRHITLAIFIFIPIMFITIKKSLDLYYKQMLLIKDLEETKKELESKKKEIEELEKENLEFSKTSHSLAHKQRALEYKINELVKKDELNKISNIQNEMENLSKRIYNEQVTTEITSTGIERIDNMLKYMQSECLKYGIDFELQINGNIHYMTNHFITAEELEILIADHVKDAIIAINYSDNINKSILVKLGLIDDCYGLYIYDSGIEFGKDTLENLGKKPVTTHADNEGTGMGFMNTFDTLKKHKGSLIIDQIGPPSKDNFTKIIKIRFDEKNEFNIKNYNQ